MKKCSSCGKRSRMPVCLDCRRETEEQEKQEAEILICPACGQKYHEDEGHTCPEGVES